MSFYGHSFFEFSKLFSRFGFSNKGKNNKKATELSDSSATIQDASGRWEQLNFETGNQWIGFEQIEDEGVKGITISHNKPSDETVTTVYGFTPITQEEADKLEIEKKGLEAGALVRATVSYFDDAGHCSTVEDSIYELPSTEIVLNDKKTLTPNPEDNRLHFNSDNWINLNTNEELTNLTIQHTKSFEENKIGIGFEYQGDVKEDIAADRKLFAGDFFTTSQVIYDEAGHATQVENITYQLPISQTETDISDIKEELETVKNNITDIQIELTDTIPNTYATINFAGQLSDLYNKDNTDNIPYTSITSAIGNIQQMTRDLVGDQASTEIYTLAEAITIFSKIATDTQQLAISINTLNNLLTERVNALEERVKALEQS